MGLSVKHLRDLFGGDIPTAQVLQGVASGMADCDVKVLIDPNITVPRADPEQKRIMLPAKVKSARALLIVSWYVDHESGHIIYTPPFGIFLKKWLREGKMYDICTERGYGGIPDKILEAAKYFLNFCEDVRIERLMIGRFPGSKKHFIGGPIAAECDDLVETTVQAATDKATEEGLPEVPLNPFWVGELHAFHLLGGSHGQRERGFVRETVPAHVHWVCDIVGDVFGDIHDVTQVTCQELADRTDIAMGRILDKVLPDQTQPQPQQGGQGQQGKQQQQGDQGESSQSPFNDKMEAGGTPQKSKYEDLRREAEEEGGGSGDDGADEGGTGSDDHRGSEEHNNSDEDDGSKSSSGDSESGDDADSDEAESGDSSGSGGDESDQDGGDSGQGGSSSGEDSSEQDGGSEGAHGGSSGAGSDADDGKPGEQSDSDDDGEFGGSEDGGDDGEGDGEGDGSGESERQGDEWGDDGAEGSPVEDPTAETGAAPLAQRIEQIMAWADEAQVDMSEIMSRASEFQSEGAEDSQNSGTGNRNRGAGSPNIKHATDISGMPDEYLKQMSPGCGVTVIADLDLNALFNGKDPVFEAYDVFTRSLMPKTLGPAARKLVGKFQGSAAPAWAGNRINPKMLQPIMAGKAHGRRLYMKRTDPVQSRRGVCVALAIDCSGSMCGAIPGLKFQPGNYDKQTKFVVAHAAARSLARLFQTINVPFAVTGFTTKDIPSGGGSRYSYSSRYSRAYDIVNFVFKNFSEPWTCCEQRMLAMNQYTNIRYKGEEICAHTNSDGESLLWLASDMIGREEDRKIMIVLSDGLPYAGDSLLQSKFLRWAVRRIEISGIRIGGLGLGDRGVANYYRVHELLDSFPAGYGTEATAPLYIQEKILRLIDRLSD